MSTDTPRPEREFQANSKKHQGLEQTPRPERVYRPGDRALVLFGDGVRRPATLSDGFAWVADGNPAKVIFAEGGFDAEPAPRPERVTLSAEECSDIVRASIAPDRVLSGRTGHDGSPPDVLLVTVERILAAREQALREEDPTREQVARYLERQSKAAGVPQVAGMYAIEWAHAIRGGAR